MNTANILAVADAIEQHTIEDLGFNMGLWAGKVGEWGAVDHSGHNCGTVACIGGTADAIRLRTLNTDTILGASVIGTQKWLGIDYETAAKLFYMEGVSSLTVLADVSADQAVRTLRHLAATGNVDWTV